MPKKSNITIGLALLIMLVFFIVKTSVLVGIWYSTPTTRATEYICFLFFIPLFWFIIKDILRKGKLSIKENSYSKKLNNSLVHQSRNEIFYSGNISESAKIITREITEILSVDRASVWFYNNERTSIICQQLYVKAEGKYYEGIEIKEKDYPQYFNALSIDPIIIADNAETHESTSCFTDTYLKPLGIKSMLDVPIWYRGSILGVICIEALSNKNWILSEINFAQIISSLYSFGYSVKESNRQKTRIKEIEEFIDQSNLVSKADENGKITYVNKKFTELSGYSLEEVLGKDHNIVNSGQHPSSLWTNMYKTVVKERKIWNHVVTNKDKNGNFYYVDTHIKAEFDEETGKLKGFASIRQDVTDLKRKETEIKNRMNAINKSNAVIEFDLEGKIIFANDLFCQLTGYKESEIVGKPHKIFVSEEYLFSNSRSKDYKSFWDKLKKGVFVSGEFERVTKSGKKIWLQASYNPIVDNNGNAYKIMKIATDITERIKQSEEIEKKNTYLEHAAKILRHDMHSGINTYMPRGLSSLERRITEEQMKDLKIDSPIKMIKEGLRHTQKVYKGVYEFTNLVKKDVVLNRTEYKLNEILEDYLSATAYRSQVILDDLGTLSVNEALFCTAIDNLIRNGLKYNDSLSKVVKIRRDENFIYVEDNGRGMTNEEFKILSKPYTRKEGQKETGTGLGLNICIAILEEHGFYVNCDKILNSGTQMKIKISH